jgi:ectoine hydroxylase-related dioxygenase (phytanoyl-CoA dioxygenase family)
MFDEKRFLREINTLGYSVVEDVLPADFIASARTQLERAITEEARYHGSTDYQDFGMVLLCSLYGGAFIELFDIERLTRPFECVLGEGCIVYAYTSSSMPPCAANYSRRIHVDCPRVIPGYVTNLGATILLDDFTEENGATWFLPASHERAEAPDDSYFYEHARRLVAKAGTVWYFNARIWHAGGINRTDRWRHALTINMCRPWMKQRLDVPRVMADLDLSNISQKALQKLGFLAQVPASYDEYHAPPEHRKYRQKVE